MLWNADDLGMTLRYRSAETAARTLGLEVQPLGVREPEDFAAAFAARSVLGEAYLGKGFGIACAVRVLVHSSADFSLLLGVGESRFEHFANRLPRAAVELNQS